MTCVVCGYSPIGELDFYCDLCLAIRDSRASSKILFEWWPGYVERRAARALLTPIERLWNFGAGMRPGDEEKFWAAVARTVPDLLPKHARPENAPGVVHQTPPPPRALPASGETDPPGRGEVRGETIGLPSASQNRTKESELDGVQSEEPW